MTDAPLVTDDTPTPLCTVVPWNHADAQPLPLSDVDELMCGDDDDREEG
jgi:hypothetical protein